MCPILPVFPYPGDILPSRTVIGTPCTAIGSDIAARSNITDIDDRRDILGDYPLEMRSTSSSSLTALLAVLLLEVDEEVGVDLAADLVARLGVRHALDHAALKMEELA